jgi:diguanylate cyclase (GGDEF)-like protein/PAS domain S-box-containing protein
MSSDRSSRGGRFADGLLVFALVALLASFSKYFTRDDTGLSALWFANALAVGFLLTTRREDWPWLLLATFAGNVLGSLVAGDPATMVAPIALFNVLESFCAAWPLRRSLQRAEDLTRRSSFAPFLLYGTVGAPAASLLACALYSPWAPRQLDVVFVQNWLLAHGLGMAIMAPVVLALRESARASLRRLLGGRELIALGLVVAVTVGVFAQSGYPLLFLVFPPMLLVALRTGFTGTSLAVLLVLLVAFPLTAAGQGPLTLLDTMAERLFVLQLLVAALLLFTFPAVVSLAERRRALRTAHDLQNRLQLLTDYGSDVVLLTDLRGFALYVSPAVRSVLGWGTEDFLAQDWRDLVHHDDADRVAGELRAVIGQAGRRTVAFRFRAAGGADLWLEAQVSWFRDADLLLFDRRPRDGARADRGASGQEGLVLSMRDITARKLVEQQLEVANRELELLVWKDGLTGLANRRRFDEALAQEWQRCLHGSAPLSIVLLDVDLFKDFNDRYGHQQGDRSLLRVADTIAGALFRPRDLAARYGGEEFAVILPQTDTESAARLAERIRANLADLGLPHVASPHGCVTVSAGIAGAVPVAHGSLQELVKIADEALYTSKREGRNRSTVMDVHWGGGTTA